MFNPINFISKFIKSSNQKELDRMTKIVRNVSALEESFKNLSGFESDESFKRFESFDLS